MKEAALCPHCSLPSVTEVSIPLQAFSSLFIRLLMAIGLLPALGNYKQIASAIFTCGLYVNIKFHFFLE